MPENAPGLQSQVHADQCIALHQIAFFPGLAREILVLEPPIENQPFVEPQFRDGRHSERHVAAVQIRNARHDARIMALASNEKAGFLPGNGLAFCAIAHDQAIGARDARLEKKYSGAFFEPILRRSEVIVEEYGNIGAAVDELQTLIALGR